MQVVKELKELGSIVIPTAAMNCVVHVRAMVSVLVLGRLGAQELAGGRALHWLHKHYRLLCFVRPCIRDGPCL